MSWVDGEVEDLGKMKTPEEKEYLEFFFHNISNFIVHHVSSLRFIFILLIFSSVKGSFLPPSERNENDHL